MADKIPLKRRPGDREPLTPILGRIVIGAESSNGGSVWFARGVSPASRVTQAEAPEQRFEFGGGI